MKVLLFAILLVINLSNVFAQFKIEINQNQKNKEYLTKLLKNYISESTKMENEEFNIQIIRIDKKIKNREYYKIENMIPKKNAKGVFHIRTYTSHPYEYFLFIYDAHIIILINNNYCELIRELSRYSMKYSIYDDDLDFMSGRAISGIMNFIYFIEKDKL